MLPFITQWFKGHQLSVPKSDDWYKNYNVWQSNHTAFSKGAASLPECVYEF
jgi:hypothetical protein